MKAINSDQYLHKFSEITLEALKAIAAEGKQLTADSIFASLASRPEIDALMAALADAEPLSDDQHAAMSGQIQNLSAQLEKAQFQKDRLLSNLEALESRIAQTERFYQSTVLACVELLRSDENLSFQEPLLQFKSLLKQNADISQLNTAFQHIKNAALRDSSNVVEAPKEKAKPASFLAKWLKSDESANWKTRLEKACSNQIREVYQGIIDEFKRCLDKESLDKLGGLENRLGQIGQLDHFLSVRKDILVLIQDFISRVDGEREQTTAFIREVGNRLVELDSHIFQSIESVRQGRQANTDFALQLEDQLAEIKGSIDFSKTLAELKGAVVLRLRAIKEIIASKREQDADQTAGVDGKIDLLQQDLGRMQHEMDKARKHAENLERELLMDPLTEIYNRRAYDKRVNEELRRYQRYDRPFSMLLFDVDHFKRINDQFGHAIGDKCLKEIIKRVKPILRQCDFLARFGGEEFIVLLPETDRSGARVVAEKLRCAVEQTQFMHKGQRVPVTVSTGVTQVGKSDADSETLFNRMDQAMYQAKNAGRNRVEVL